MARADAITPTRSALLEPPAPSLVRTLLWGFARVFSIVVLTVAFLGFVADRGYQMLMNRMLQWREQTP